MRVRDISRPAGDEPNQEVRQIASHVGGRSRSCMLLPTAIPQPCLRQTSLNRSQLAGRATSRRRNSGRSGQQSPCSWTTQGLHPTRRGILGIGQAILAYRLDSPCPCQPIRFHGRSEMGCVHQRELRPQRSHVHVALVAGSTNSSLRCNSLTSGA